MTFEVPVSNYDDDPWRAPGETPGEEPAAPSDATSESPNVEETAQQQTWTPPADEPPLPYAADTAAPVERKQSSWAKWIAVAAVSALIGGGVGAGTAVTIDGDEEVASTATTDNSTRRPDASSVVVSPNTIRSVLEKVEPAVVTIEIETARGASGSGTGMIITPDGEILTNAHVVQGARTIDVTLQGETLPRRARLLGMDSSIDAALLKLEGATNLRPVEFGDSNAVQVGDGVVAVGNALALPGGPSVTSGIVSAKDRSISDATASLEDLIQTDAAINPGNSGGPLADMSGRVVGMNTAVIRGQGGEFENIGFAMAINSIQPVLDQLRSGATTAPAYLGVSTVTLDEDIKQRFGLTPDSGAVVATVQPESPADDAGLGRFDVIVRFDGRDVDSNDALVRFVRSKRPGDRVTIVFFRDDERREAEVTLAARPDSG